MNIKLNKDKDDNNSEIGNRKNIDDYRNNETEG